jgi:16S rRNA (guanine527-N7)-methyltransferase
VKHARKGTEELAEQAEALGVALSPERAEGLLRFESMLIQRAGTIGAIARSDLGRVRERHILDCLRCVPLVRPDDGDAYDLGSGAGLPGVVIAIACPGLRIGLIEPRRIRVALLELAVQELGLSNARVLAVRSQDLRSTVDVCFARALAPPERTWALAEPLLRPSGRLVCFAGAGWPRVPEIPGVAISVLPPEPAVLESAGPVVIMTPE